MEMTTINIRFSRRWTGIVQHSIAWLLYAAYFYAMNVLENPGLSLGAALLAVMYCSGVFYGVYFILQHYFAVKRYISGSIMLLFFYMLSSILSYGLLYGPMSMGFYYGEYLVEDHVFSWREFVQSLLVMHGNYTVLAVLYYQYRRTVRALTDRYRETRRRLLAEQQRTAYEYTTLSAQVSPHLMANIFDHWANRFAALSPAYSDRVDASYGLMKFYMEAHDPDGPMMILLHDEMRAVRQLIDIHQQVSGRRVQVVVEEKGNLMRFMIPPTTVLTLVENALKHGDVYDPDIPVQVWVHAYDKGYRIRVRNKKRLARRPVSSHGVGQANLRRRLDIALGGNYVFDKHDGETLYEVSIRYRPEYVPDQEHAV